MWSAIKFYASKSFMKNIFLTGSIFSSMAILEQTKASGIDATEIVTIGGIKQVIRIIGEDKTNPVLLYLHGSGGSGSTIISKADQLTSKLQAHFVVVLWDQREYGETLQLNKSSQTLSVQLLVDDTHELIEYVLQKMGQRSLYLVGHSMGSLLGIHIAQKYPALLNAFVAMSPPVDGMESQRVALETLKAHFKKINHPRAIQELAGIRIPATDFESLFTQYRWQAEYDGEYVTDEMEKQARPVLMQWMETWGAVYREVYAMNFFTMFPALKCPVYLFTGRKDLQTNASITENYYKKLKAPKKKLFWFEKSAHALPDTEPERMQDILIHEVLTDTQGQ